MRFIFLENFIYFIYRLLEIISFLFKDKWKFFFEIRKKPLLVDEVSNKEHIWFHVSSAGELEQALPIAENIRKQGYGIVVSYFSPSTQPFLNRLPEGSVSFALPFHSRCLSKYLTNFNIKHALFIKYEIWPSIIIYCRKKNIHYSFVFMKRFIYKKFSLKYFFKKHFDLPIYKQAKNVFCIENHDLIFFKSNLGLKNAILSGDAKWERAFKHRMTIEDTLKKNLNLLSMKIYIDYVKNNNKKVIIFGSPHKEEYEIFLSLLKFSNVFMILAPHDITSKQLDKIKFDIKKNSKDYVLMSQITVPIPSICFESYLNGVIVVDKIGYLAPLYSLADLAIIGGGFDGNIHNVLEPAAQAVPTIFGSNHQKAPEAYQLIKNGCAKDFRNTNQLKEFLITYASNLEISGHIPNTLDFMKENAKKTFENIKQSSIIISNKILE